MEKAEPGGGTKAIQRKGEKKINEGGHGHAGMGWQRGYEKGIESRNQLRRLKEVRRKRGV